MWKIMDELTAYNATEGEITSRKNEVRRSLIERRPEAQ
jgi:hypothetical protein